MLKNQTDTELIVAIRAGETQRENAWNFIFSHWIPEVYAAAKKCGATEKEARDALTICVMDFEKRIKNEDFMVEKSLKDYLAKCIENAYKKHKPKHNHFEAPSENIQVVPLLNREPEDNTFVDAIEYLDINLKSEIIKLVEKAAKRKCGKIISDSLDKIRQNVTAEQMNTTTNTIKVQLGRCMRALRAWVAQNPQYSQTLKAYFINHGR